MAELKELDLASTTANLLGNLNFDDIFYVIEGKPRTIEDIIQMKVRDPVYVKQLRASGQIFSTKEARGRQEIVKVLNSLGAVSYNLAILTGLPPLENFQFPSQAVKRGTPEDVVAWVTAQKIPFASKVAIPDLRDATATLSGVKFEIELADYRTSVLVDFNPPSLVIKADAVALSTLRDLRYSITTDGIDTFGLIPLWDKIADFSKTHYYGHLSMEVSLERYRLVRLNNLLVREACKERGVFGNFGKIVSDPERLLQVVDPYTEEFERISPPAVIHRSIIDKWRSIVNDVEYKARIYSMNYLADQFADLLWGDPIKDTSPFQVAVMDDYSVMVAARPELTGLVVTSVGVTIDKLTNNSRFVVKRRGYGPNFKATASAGALYNDRKHGEVAISELYEATGTMLWLGGIRDNVYACNFPREVKEQDAFQGLVDSYRMYYLKPKHEVYDSRKKRERNILVGSYPKEIPMSLFMQLTYKFDHHMLNDRRSQSMMGTPLTVGCTDLFLKVGSLGGGVKTFAMSDNNYLFFKFGGVDYVSSFDVAKAEGSMSQLMAYIVNRRFLKQMGMGSGIGKLKTKVSKKGEVVETTGRLNKKKKEEELIRTGELKDFALQGAETKTVSQTMYIKAKSTPPGWRRYMLEFYPLVAVDVNVIYRTTQLHWDGIPSGITLTAIYNFFKSLKAQAPLAKIVQACLNKEKASESNLEKLIVSELSTTASIRNMELAMTLECLTPLRPTDNVVPADLLGFDLKFLDPKDGGPPVWLPVLRWDSLVGILLFHKFEKGLDNSGGTQNMKTLGKNLLTVICLKVAFYMGAWAHPGLTYWIAQSLKRMYQSFPDLKLLVSKLTDAAIEMSIDELNDSLFGLVGSSIINILRNPALDLSNVFRVYGHQSNTWFHPRSGMMVCPAAIVKIFDNYVPVTDDERILNLVAVYSRRYMTSGIKEREKIMMDFEPLVSIYFNYLYSGVVDPKSPVGDCVLVAGGLSLEKRMQVASDLFGDFNRAEAPVMDPDLEASFMINLDPNDRVHVGTMLMPDFAGDEDVFQDIPTQQQEAVSNLPLNIRVHQRSKDQKIAGSVGAVKLKGFNTVTDDETRSALLSAVRQWSKETHGPTTKKAKVEPGDLYEVFKRYMPKFTLPKGGGFYTDRHLTKNAILKFYAFLDKKSSEDRQELPPILQFSRHEMSQAFSAAEASAGKNKNWTALPTEVEEAKLPQDNKANRLLFFRKLLTEIMDSHAVEDDMPQQPEVSEVAVAIDSVRRPVNEDWSNYMSDEDPQEEQKGVG